MLVSSPFSLYVDSSSDEVCSFRGCCCEDIALRGSDSTMMLDMSSDRPQHSLEVKQLVRRGRVVLEAKRILPELTVNTVMLQTHLVGGKDIVSLPLARSLQQYFIVGIHDHKINIE